MTELKSNIVDINAMSAVIYNPNFNYCPEAQFWMVVNSIAVIMSNEIKDYHRKKSALLIIKIFIPDWEKLFNKNCAPLNRHDNRVSEWKKKVLERDGYKCVECEETVDLEAHHILTWADYPEGRIDIDNGVTLCNKCHANQHIDEYQLILNRGRKK